MISSLYFRLIVLFFLVLNFSSFAQDINSIDKILIESKRAISKLKSVKYKVTQKGLTDHSAYFEFEAVVIQQKKEVIKDVGLGMGYLKAFGQCKQKNTIEKFRFLYNGDVFVLKKGDSYEKTVSNPSIKSVPNLLHFLTQVRTMPFLNKNPYKPVGPDGYTFLGIEEQNGELCYKIFSELVGKTPKGYTVKISKTYWINKKTLLPIAYKDENHLKEIQILEINKNYPKEVFSHKNIDTSKIIDDGEVLDSINKTLGIHKLSVMPQWHAKDQNGKLWESKSLKNKVVFIDFWGTWCSPCKKAMPEIEQLYQYYKNNKQVVILGISANEKTKNAASLYFKKNGFSYAHIPNGDTIVKTFGVMAYPTIYIIDKMGNTKHFEIDYKPNSLKKWKAVINQLIQ
ncbi:thioredoxin-like domain-containing protein [uncultured Psychroserpens sp.]|uniref:thioredoxin-like domain-containing protein n=1 Tax=uncultured Psychroserpens sp. TaxID=255436 RepID=UPI002617F490|nr:thioredoxin-like domain-containing protein [uncultured Psychroserpens sp.]